MEQPAFLVSVICVTRNAAAQLPGLIDSVRKYKTPEIEFIVIDGNSTDETVNCIKQNTDVIDFWLSEPDKGIYDAMNKAVGYAHGKWLYFIGADDALMDGFAQMLPLLKDEHKVYYGGVIYHGKPLSKEFDAYRLAKSNICHQAIFYPAAVFKKYSYDTRYVIWADFHMNIRCWADPQFKFEYHDHIVAHYGQGGFSETAVDTAFEKEREGLIRKYLGAYAYWRFLNRQHGTLGMIKRIFKTT
jgi:glycosyltransferase involved in cell wall biosynthesis